MSKIYDGGPAFPRNYTTAGRSGMSMRDWFAGQALAGINANPTWDKNGWYDRAQASYVAADAMIAARSGGQDDE